MNIVNYEIESGIANNTLNIRKKSEGKYDDLAQKIFRSDCPYFAAPVSEVTINGETIFKYDLGNYTAIENINMKMSGSEFMSLLKNLITPLTECCDWMLDSHYYLMSPEFVFVSAYDYKIRYIYSFDLDNRCDDGKISAFFSEIIKKVRITDSTDLNNELLRMVVDNNVSVSSLLDMVKRYGNSSAFESNAYTSKRKVPPVPVQTAVPVVEETPKKAESKPEIKFPKLQQRGESKEEKQSNNDDMFSSERNEAMEKLFGGGKNKKSDTKKSKDKKSFSADKGKDSLLSFLKKDKTSTIKNEAPAAAQSQYLTDVSGGDETVFAGDGDETEFAGTEAYFLLKEKNGELNAPYRIDVILDENGEMCIGRQSEGANNNGYKFDAEFKKISRRHAMITHKGSDYFITDLNSANKTIMNGQTLQPDVAYTMEDGSVLIFGDSLYVYEFKIV